MSFFSSVGQAIRTGLDANTAFFSHPIVSLTQGIGAAEKLNQQETGTQKAINIVGTTATAAAGIIGGAAAVGALEARTLASGALAIAKNPTVTKTAAKVGAYSLALGSLPTIGTAKEFLAFTLAPVPAAIGTAQKFLSGGFNGSNAKDAALGFLSSPTGEATAAAAVVGAGAAATKAVNAIISDKSSAEPTPTRGVTSLPSPSNVGTIGTDTATPITAATQNLTTTRKHRHKAKVQEIKPIINRVNVVVQNRNINKEVRTPVLYG